LSFEGLLALIGIIIAVYALAQPIQRQSIRLLVPIKVLILSIFISAGLLIWRYSVGAFGYKFFPWSDFASMVGGFFLPIIGVIVAYIFWHRAKLSVNKNRGFRKFILTCIKENKYDELLRILDKNRESAAKVLQGETLGLLFKRKFIKNAIDAQNWMHLRLLSNEKIIEKLTDRLGAINNLMRELVAAEDSLLHFAITSKYGGREHVRASEEEWKLIHRTLENPKWYMCLRADYPLMVYAYETIASNKLDRAYNLKDDLYIFQQGESTRLRCPIYIALKTHVLMLKEAIKIEGEDDYYVSDFWDLFQAVCEHSKYDNEVWEDQDANREYPTPFAFLMKEMLYDLKDLCQECSEQGQRPPGRIGDDLIRTWATCVSFLGNSSDEVSDRFKIECLGYYLGYTMEMMEAYDKAKGIKKENLKLWQDELIDELRRFRGGDERLREILIQSMNELDYGKRYIWDNHVMLRKELDLPDRPRPAN